MSSYKNSSSHTSGAGWAIPTLTDCWHVRDLQRFRAILKGGPGAAVPIGNNSSHAPNTNGSRSPTSYGSHSYGTLASNLAPAPPAEVNRKDYAGRTALHHIASSEEGVSIDFLHAILAHPSCNINAQDAESGWTPLHRALYHGNLNHALTLLCHSAIDVRIKDLEGLTPFDLYNSTVAGTNPAPLGGAEAYNNDVRGGDLFLWGSNRNYSLGVGDGNDRSLPDLVSLSRGDPSGGRDISPDSRSSLPPGRTFDRIKVKEVQMSRMHTVVLTEEKSGRLGNIWVAGIGSNGRLGRAPSTQSTLQPLQDFKEHATKIAVGADHTLIVTASGAVYSFGSNRFGTLGYAIEEGFGQVASSSGTSAGIGGAGAATFGAGQQPTNYTDKSSKTLDVQITPRRVVGPLKKEVVLGAAVSKLHSAVFTQDALYTWGTNTGQLGYDKQATPLQINPRKVTSLTSSQSIRQVACTDHATALLLNSFDVVVLHGDASFKLSFPMTRFNERMSAGVFRPPQAQPKPSIAKLTSSGNTFAALSDYGDLFTFSLDHPSEYAKASGVSKRPSAPEPQLVWSVRKKFTAVRDVAIGSDGSIILCTSSGHVFVRSRRGAAEAKQSNKSGAARAFKFAQMPLLQRVVKVATNENGGFAAIRSHAPIRDIRTKGRGLEDDLRDLLPHLQVWSTDVNGNGAVADQQQRRITADIGSDFKTVEEDNEEESNDLKYGSDVDSDDDNDASEVGDDTAERHTSQALLIIEAAKRFDRGTSRAEASSNAASFADLRLPFGCDMILIAGGKHLPAHRCIVSARVQSLAHILENPPTKGAANAPPGVVAKKVNDTITTLTLPGCTFHTGLFLLHYIYTDDLPAIWTASIGLRVEKQLAVAKVNRNTVHSQLRELASVLGLPALTPVFNSPVPTQPTPTLRADMLAFYNRTVKPIDLAKDSLGTSPLHDMQLQLSDRLVPAHSVLLRRSPFFAALLQPDWSAARWDEGKLRVDLRHLRWEVVSLHLRHIYTDEGRDIFTGLDTELKLDDWIDFVTEALAGGNEFLLDRFKLVSASLLRDRIAPQNIAAMLTIADMYYSLPLKEAALLYCAQNLESLLEGGMLDELEHKMVRELAAFIKRKQDEKMHRTRESDHLAALIVKHSDFYDNLDIPPASLNVVSHRFGKRPPRSANAVLPGAANTGKAANKQSMVATPLNKQDRRNLNRSGSPSASPSFRATGAPSTPNDSGMFAMDDDDFNDSPSLGAMAASLSIKDIDQPPSLGLPPAAASAPWALAGANGRNKSAMPRNGSANGSSRAVTPSQTEAGPSSSSDLRSIMAAEMARSKHSVSQSRPTEAPGSMRRLASGSVMPNSPPTSGTATPSRMQVPVQSDSDATTGPSEPLSASFAPLAQTKMSQKDRKKQQALTLAQAQAQAQANALSQQPSSSPSSGPQASPWKAMPSATRSEGVSELNGAEGAAPNAVRPPLRPNFASQRGGSSNSGAGGSGSASGPLYTPTRSGANTSQSNNVYRQSFSARSGGSDAVWSSQQGASVSATSPNASSSGLSFHRGSIPHSGAGTQSESPSPMLRASQPPSFQRVSSSIDTDSFSSSPRAGSSSLTFAQIQAQQAAAAAASSAVPAKKSFMEIQAEETRQAEEKMREDRERVEFEKWFEEESKRVRASEGSENKRSGGAKNNSRGGGGKKTTQDKKKDGQGESSANAPTTNSGKGKPGGSSAKNPKQKNNNRSKGSKAKATENGPSNNVPAPQTQQQQQQQQQTSLSATASVFSPSRLQS
ncbi:unnamed protein product [Sympodiomycopsis kandeliae]